MAVRFRIRTPAGQELSFASREMFEEFVRSGDLSPEDLVFDGESGSWSPAHTHPTFVEIQYEKEAETGRLGAPADDGAESGDGRVAVGPGPADPTAASNEVDRYDASAREADDEASLGEGDEGAKDVLRNGGATDSTATGDDDDLGLDLALHEEESAEEAKRRLIAQLEAERESELNGGSSIQESLAGFTVESGPYGDLIRDPTRPPSGPSAARPRPSGARRRPSTSPASTGRGRPRAAQGGGPRKKAGWLGRLVFFLLLLSLLAGGAYIGYEVLSSGPVEELPGAGDPEGDASGPPEIGQAMDDPEVGQALEESEVARAVDDPAVRLAAAVPATSPAGAARGTEREPDVTIIGERARERYLASTQAALRDLQAVPDFWPDASYLVMPTGHPEVVDLWQGYMATIRDVRVADEERFRLALEAALDEAGLDPQGSEQMRRSILDRQTEEARLRRAHFDRVEALASAALRSHDALVDAEGLLLFDATVGQGIEEAIGHGVSGRDADAQLLLDQVVTLLTARLDADGEGPGSPEKVREWVWDGFLDAATR